MLDILKQDKKEGESTIIVEMYIKYITSSGGVGKRTYRAKRKYGIDQYLLAEMQEHPELLGEQSWGHHSECSRPEYEMVAITPKITRALSSDGVDTFFLKSGVPITVPGNLAAYLQASEQA